MKIVKPNSKEEITVDQVTNYGYIVAQDPKGNWYHLVIEFGMYNKETHTKETNYRIQPFNQGIQLRFWRYDLKELLNYLLDNHYSVYQFSNYSDMIIFLYNNLK